MIYFDAATSQYRPYALRVTFYDRDTFRVKYDHNEKYWREFVKKWWHHHSLNFEPLVLSDEQQARLDEVNQAAIPQQWLGEVAVYVEFGYVEPESQCPYLSDKAELPENLEARYEHLLNQKRQELAAHRYKVETGGVVTDQGMKVLTDRESQAQLTSAYQTLKEGVLTQIDWKSANGWVQVTLEDITPIAHLVAAHVQPCFTAERRVDEQMEALGDYDALLAFDPTDAFDTALIDIKTTPEQ